MELGAGFHGLCGFVANKLGAQDVVLTDAEAISVSTLAVNCAIRDSADDGIFAPAEEAKMEVTGGEIRSRVLSWTEDKADLPNEMVGAFDVVLGCELLYVEMDQISALAATASSLGREKCDVIFGWQRRDYDNDRKYVL